MFFFELFKFLYVSSSVTVASRQRETPTSPDSSSRLEKYARAIIRRAFFSENRVFPSPASSAACNSALKMLYSCKVEFSFINRINAHQLGTRYQKSEPEPGGKRAELLFDSSSSSCIHRALLRRHFPYLSFSYTIFGLSSSLITYTDREKYLEIRIHARS